jgi:PAS domain S-box-containing protein
MDKLIHMNPEADPASARSQPEQGSPRFHMRDVPIGKSLRQLWGAWSLLAAGLMVSALAALYIKTGVERAAQREFEYVCNQVGRSIGHRLDAASLLLRSGAAFLAASESVTRDEWRAFSRRLQMEQYMPGIQGIGFALLIPREQLDRHIQTVREEGCPDYQVSPAGEREVYSSIIYLEPFSDRNRRAFGYDMLSEPVRRAAMEQARDQNTAALSGKVVLVQETGQDVQPGSLLYFPVYRQGAPTETIEQRRAAIGGWVYSPYRMTDLIRGTLGDWQEHPKSKGISLQIYDGDDLSAGRLLYSHPGGGDRSPDSAARVARVIPIDFAGHRWTLRFAQTGRLTSPTDYGMAWLVLLSGMLIDLMLFGLILWRQQSVRFYHEQTQSAVRLRASETRYRRLFESAKDGILILDAESGSIEDVNPFLIELLGHPRESFLGKKIWDLGFFRDIVANQSNFTELQRQEYIRYDDKPLETADGRKIEVEFFSNVYLVDRHKVIQCNIRDITERKCVEAEREKMLTSARQSRRALLSVLADEKKMAAERTRLAAAIEQAAETIMITDAQGSIVYVNPAFEITTGYSREEILGQNPRILQSGKHDAEFYRGMWATLTAGRVWRGHLSNKRKDGTHYEEDATLSPIRDPAGQTVNYVAVKRDVTREAELEAQLRQAQKMESIGRLAGGVAHDFNNLIMGVMGYTELVRNQLPPDHPACADLNEIMSGARRTAALTKQLLAFARKQAVEPREMDLNDAIANMLNMLRQLIGEDINLIWSPGAALWSVKMDPGQIDQIMANLCVNGRDAISGVGKITIETANSTMDESFCVGQPEAVPGDYVLCMVSDDGCGMTKDVLERIFEPFYTTKGVGEGTGLGLATVYGIVRQNNGFINVYSEPGKGTTFRIYLPRLESATAKETELAETRERRIGTETVLLVEDEKGVRAITARFLEQLGYSVLTAEAPDEAIRMVERYAGTIHMLITDVIMPGMSGRDLAIKLAETRPGMKTLYISGYTASVISQRGILEENVHFLPKPFTREALARKMRDVLDAD